MCPQRVWLLFGRGLSLALGPAQCPAQTSVPWHRQSVCSPVCSWELGPMSQPCPSAHQPSQLLCMIGLLGWTPDHIYSWLCLKWTALVKKLFIITTWPCSVLWDCVVVTESTAVTLGSPSGSNPATASPHCHHCPNPSLGADIWYHGIVLMPISIFDRDPALYTVQQHHKEQKDNLYYMKR